MIKRHEILLSLYAHERLDNEVISKLNLPFVLLNASTTLAEQRIDWERDDYPFTVIEYVVSGSGDVEIDGNVFSTAPGDIYILPCHIRHKLIITDHKNGWVKKYFVVTGPFSDTLLEAYGLKGEFYFPESGSERIDRLFDKMIEIFNISDTNMHDNAAIIMHEIMQFLKRYSSEKIKLSINALNIRHYLEINLYSKFNMDKMACTLGISKRNLFRICRAELGISPYEYHLQRRIAMAKQLLALSKNSRIREIAYKLNFKDKYHFSRIFRQKEGITASEYRKQFSGK